MSEPVARLTDTGKLLLCVVWGLSWVAAGIFTLVGWVAVITDARDASWEVSAVATAYFVGATIGAWAGRYLE